MSKKEYDAKYQKEQTVVVSVRLHREYDADILERLDNLDDLILLGRRRESRSGFFKRCVRWFIENEKRM